jgi:hypothetical protein
MLPLFWSYAPEIWNPPGDPSTGERPPDFPQMLGETLRGRNRQNHPRIEKIKKNPQKRGLDLDHPDHPPRIKYWSGSEGWSRFLSKRKARTPISTRTTL